MAKTITYTVAFCTAKRTVGELFTSLELNLSDLMNAKRNTVEAAGFADLEAKVRALAAQFGRNCHASIRLADRKARKPAGFDAFCKTLDFIEVAGDARTNRTIDTALANGQDPEEACFDEDVEAERAARETIEDFNYVGSRHHY